MGVREIDRSLEQWQTAKSAQRIDSIIPIVLQGPFTLRVAENSRQLPGVFVCQPLNSLL